MYFNSFYVKWPELIFVMAFGGGGDYDTPKEWHTEFLFYVTVYPCGVTQPTKGLRFYGELRIMHSDFALCPETITTSKQEKILFILFRFNDSVL